MKPSNDPTLYLTLEEAFEYLTREHGSPVSFEYSNGWWYISTGYSSDDSDTWEDAMSNLLDRPVCARE